MGRVCVGRPTEESQVRGVADLVKSNAIYLSTLGKIKFKPFKTDMGFYFCLAYIYRMEILLI